jgi:hypothetical protein
MPGEIWSAPMRGSMRETLGAWDKPLPKTSQARRFRIDRRKIATRAVDAFNQLHKSVGTFSPS